MEASELCLNIRPARGDLIVNAGSSASYKEKIDEPVFSSAPASQFQESTSLSSQSTPHVSSNRTTHQPIRDSIANKSTGPNKNLFEIKEFSNAIDAYFSSTEHNQDINNQSSGNHDYLNTIPSLFSTKTCYNSLPSNALLIHPFNQNFYTGSREQNVPRERAKGCSKAEGPWIPSVAKKILACYYSELHIKSEFLSTQIMLDDYESLVLREAVQAFQDIAFTNPNYDSDLGLIPYELYADPRPIELINSFEKLRSYRKLHIEDKIRLTQSAFFDVNCVKGTVTYVKAIDGWYWGGGILPRGFVDVSDHTQALKNLLLTFPDCLRNDINIVVLLYLIVLFNPDLPKLKFRNSIRQQQYIYIYLLKRHLVSLFGSNCEASDYHYLLLTQVEQAMNIPDSAVFEKIQSGSTALLRNHVAGLVKLKSVTM